jgi:hypothetical protein
MLLRNDFGAGAICWALCIFYDYWEVVGGIEEPDFGP